MPHAPAFPGGSVTPIHAPRSVQLPRNAAHAATRSSCSAPSHVSTLRGCQAVQPPALTAGSPEDTARIRAAHFPACSSHEGISAAASRSAPPRAAVWISGGKLSSGDPSAYPARDLSACPLSRAPPRISTPNSGTAPAPSGASPRPRPPPPRARFVSQAPPTPTLTPTRPRPGRERAAKMKAEAP
ncbi:nascent polypeptide-associated complex subunit alpha, muscle-specific form-like [Cavia porcellus]|uniref:nascent polypeptide-associated complex subunit alpha, muscle-specific form-like n=1 Tax=Cavia porcellus TaxID=10141 RepID=UPI002FE0944A